MFEKTVIAASVIVLVTGGIACAQTPSRLNQFEAWGTYSYKSSQNTICYVLSVPLNALPTTVNHGDNFFLVTKRSQSLFHLNRSLWLVIRLKKGQK